MDLDHLEAVANGEPFDVTPTMRQLASHVVILRRASATMDAGNQGATLEQVLPDHVAAKLAAAGLTTVDGVATADDDTLQAIDGIGPKTVEEIRQAIPYAA